MVSLNMHGAIKSLHQGSLKCTSLSVPKKNWMVYISSLYRVVMRLWSSLSMALVLCSQNEWDCQTLENRIGTCLAVCPTVCFTQIASYCFLMFFFLLRMVLGLSCGPGSQNFYFSFLSSPHLSWLTLKVVHRTFTGASFKSLYLGLQSLQVHLNTYRQKLTGTPQT